MYIHTHTYITYYIHIYYTTYTYIRITYIHTYIQHTYTHIPMCHVSIQQSPCIQDQFMHSSMHPHTHPFILLFIHMSKFDSFINPFIHALIQPCTHSHMFSCSNTDSAECAPDPILLSGQSGLPHSGLLQKGITAQCEILPFTFTFIA